LDQAKPNSQTPASATQPVSAQPQSQAPATSPKEFVLEDATPLKLRINRTISSADAHVGDTVDFEVLEEVLVNNVLVVLYGVEGGGSRHRESLGYTEPSDALKATGQRSLSCLLHLSSDEAQEIVAVGEDLDPAQLRKVFVQVDLFLSGRDSGPLQVDRCKR